MSEKIGVASRDPAKENSPIAGPVEDAATVTLDATRTCLWNGEEFLEGQVVVAEGVEFECSLGQWVQRSS